MTVQTLVLEIDKLPLGDRLLLLEAIARSVRGELHRPTPGTQGSITDSLLGILKYDSADLSDAQLRDEYTNCLTGKYSLDPIS